MCPSTAEPSFDFLVPCWRFARAYSWICRRNGFLLDASETMIWGGKYPDLPIQTLVPFVFLPLDDNVRISLYLGDSVLIGWQRVAGMSNLGSHERRLELKSRLVLLLLQRLNLHMFWISTYFAAVNYAIGTSDNGAIVVFIKVGPAETVPVTLEFFLAVGYGTAWMAQSDSIRHDHLTFVCVYH